MINLKKGDAPVRLEKSDLIWAKIEWPAKTDYDLGAEILYKDGTTESIATFGANGVPAKMISRNLTVRHTGDARRGADMASETLEIFWDDEIHAIAPWAYSAQSNGSGSFRKYAVSMEVSTGGDTVRIDASSASRNPAVYTCVPGVIYFDGDKVVVEYVEKYSKMGSEKRPAWRSHELVMDGPGNNYK